MVISIRKINKLTVKLKYINNSAICYKSGIKIGHAAPSIDQNWQNPYQI